MGLFKKGNPVTEKQLDILQSVLLAGSKEAYETVYPKDLQKQAKKILAKPKKYTSKDVAPIINEIFKY